METIRGDELAQRYEEIIDRAAADERIVVSHAGKQAALVSIDDLAFLEDVDRELDEREVENVKHRLANPAEASIPFVPESIGSQPARD